jgi:DNA-directed RNA polymerase specialized sigma24 family protein
VRPRSPEPYPGATLVEATARTEATRRHLVRADTVQEAHLAALEALALDPEADLRAVTVRAVRRLEEARRGPRGLVSVSLDELRERNFRTPQDDDPPAPSAEDDYLAELATASAAEQEADALAALDPTVQAWAALLLVDGLNAYTAGRRVGIGHNAVARLLRAARLTEVGSRLGMTGGRDKCAHLPLVGLVGLGPDGRPRAT